ncbi:MAG: glucuronate isomerase, partial [Akkermansia sp.]|nr:glucuronate isomerase [Akkermansia sp.]
GKESLPTMQDVLDALVERLEFFHAHGCKASDHGLDYVPFQNYTVEQADAALQQSWGPAYESNMNTIGAFLRTMGERAGINVEALMENPALRANPDFARLMLEAASLMEEAPLHTGKEPDRKSEAHRIAHDPAHPLHEAYMRTSHPQHRYANEQYDRLAFGRKL